MAGPCLPSRTPRENNPAALCQTNPGLHPGLLLPLNTPSFEKLQAVAESSSTPPHFVPCPCWPQFSFQSLRAWPEPVPCHCHRFLWGWEVGSCQLLQPAVQGLHAQSLAPAARSRTLRPTRLCADPRGREGCGLGPSWPSGRRSSVPHATTRAPDSAHEGKKPHDSPFPWFKFPSPKFHALQEGSASQSITLSFRLDCQVSASPCYHVPEGVFFPSFNYPRHPRVDSLQGLLLPRICPSAGMWVILHHAWLRPRGCLGVSWDPLLHGALARPSSVPTCVASFGVLSDDSLRLLL